MPRYREYYHPATRTFHPYPASALPEPTRVPVVTDLYMDGVAATDGTDIGSRRKRNAYMREHGLADTGDFKGVWEKAAKEREQGLMSPEARRQRKEQLGRAAWFAKEKRRRAR